VVAGKFLSFDNQHAMAVFGENRGGCRAGRTPTDDKHVEEFASVELVNAADQELWTSNGTEAGTLRLASFRLINELTAVGDALFFEADDGAHGLELWASDGTPAGTRLVRDIAPGPASSSPSSLAAAGDLLLFAADDGEHGIEPWVSDGTEEGTRLLEDLAEGPTSSHPEQFRPAGALVYFRARDEEAGAQLWSIRADALSAPPRERPRATRIVPLREPIP